MTTHLTNWSPLKKKKKKKKYDFYGVAVYHPLIFTVASLKMKAKIRGV